MYDEMTADDTLRQIADDFRSFLRLYRALNTPGLRERLEDELHDQDRRVAYQLTEPGRSSRQISEAMAEVGRDRPASTIRLWQQEWIRQGLVRKVSARKRERVFNLEALGIDIGVDLSSVEEQEY